MLQAANQPTPVSGRIIEFRPGIRGGTAHKLQLLGEGHLHAAGLEGNGIGGEGVGDHVGAVVDVVLVPLEGDVGVGAGQLAGTVGIEGDGVVVIAQHGDVVGVILPVDLDAAELVGAVGAVLAAAAAGAQRQNHNQNQKRNTKSIYCY